MRSTRYSRVTTIAGPEGEWREPHQLIADSILQFARSLVLTGSVVEMYTIPVRIHVLAHTDDTG